MSQRYSRSEVDVDRYESDRRSTYTPSRARYAEPDIDFRRGSGPVPARERERERERETVIYKERDEIDSRGPAYLRDDYGRNSTTGAMVLRARDKEDVTYSTRRRRSPSVERKDREEIIIRRDERSESRPPPSRARERSRDREEIIIRRDERSDSRPEPPPPPKPRERSREREEIIIRRDERSQSRPAAPRFRERSREREEIIIKQREEDDRHYTPTRRAWTEDDRTREEIIIRRSERERDDDVVSSRSYRPPPPPPAPVTRDIDREEIIIRRERERRDEEERVSRPISHERARSVVRSRSRDSEDEIIYRRDEREGRRGEESRQEIIIRRSSFSRSPSPVESVRTAPPPPMPAPAPEPQIVYAPQIHQEVITHHRHIDHGYEVRQPPRREVVYERPPSPPSPPPAPPPESIRSRSEERIEIKRTETRNGRRREEDIIIDRNERDHSEPPPPPRAASRTRTEVDIREEIDTRQDWALRPYRQPEPEPPIVGPRYGRPRDPRDGLWTEVTKDLVVKEAIEEMGYEYEETDEYYYIFKYMAYTDVARLVGLSEDIRKHRHRRLNEIRWENSVSPRPAIEPAPPRRWIEPPVPPFRDRDRRFEREEDRYIEREVVYRGGRPPPPVGWRR